MSKFCTNCGKKVEENQDVCLNCGEKTDNVVANNVPTNNKADGQATAGFVLGLVSIIAWFIPLFGYPVTICGIVFSAKGLKSSKNKGLATAGLILSIIFLVVTVINSFLGAIQGFNAAVNNYNYYY